MALVDAPVLALLGNDSGACVRISGELAYGSLEPARRAVLQALEISPFVTLDLRACRYADSSGLGLVVETWRRCRAGGGALTLRLAPGSAPLRRVRQCGLDRLVHIEEGLDA